MIRLNLNATRREAKRIMMAANHKKMSIGQFVRVALSKVLGYSTKARQRKPPRRERPISETKSRRTGL